MSANEQTAVPPAPTFSPEVLTKQLTKTENSIGEIAFDLHSIGTILGFALDKLSDSDRYGCIDSEDGVLMCHVGQVLIDTRRRLNEYGNKLSLIADGMTVLNKIQ